MWIKTEKSLLNIDRVVEFTIFQGAKHFYVRAESPDLNFLVPIRYFKTEEEAQAYLDKLAEKLGTIDIDKD